MVESLLFGKIIHVLHPRYHPKIIGHILKNKCVCIHAIDHNENEDENEK